MKRLIILFALLFAFQVNAAGPYYIDFDAGNDSNDGLSEAEAWLTEAYALTQMASGETLDYSIADNTDIVLANWEALADAGIITQTDTITSWAITWTLTQDERFGCYATEDFWVYDVTSITIEDFTPNSTNIAGRIANGTMINPPGGGTTQGYDNETGGSGSHPAYSAALNKAFDIVNGGDDLVVATESSICSSKSHDAQQVKEQISDASILTVVDTVPSTGDFRPPFCGTDKTSYYNTSAFATQDVYASILAKIDAYGDGIGTIPPSATIQGYIARPWLHHLQRNFATFHHPTNNMEDYDAAYARNLGTTYVYLNLLSDADGVTLTDALKKFILVGVCQIGIDFYGAMVSAGENPWSLNKGAGHKWPIIFAGIVFDDSNLYDVDATYDFYTDLDTWLVTSGDVKSFPYTKVNTAYGDRWGNYKYITKTFNEYLEFATVHIDMPTWSLNHTVNTTADTPTWGVSYQYRINPYYGILLAALICNHAEPSPADWGRTLWAHDEIFDYMDRYVSIGPPNATYVDAWCVAMWAEYRANYATIAKPVYVDTYDITAAATPTSLVTDSKTHNSITVSWTGSAAAFDISVDQTTAHLGVTSPNEITGLRQNTSYDIEVWGKDANGIRSLIPRELTETTEAGPLSSVAYYKMDDAADQTTVTDSSTNSYDGTASHNIVSTAGKKGEAITFNGTTNYIAISDNADFALSNAFSVACWAKNDSSTISDGAYEVLLAQYKIAASADYAWYFIIDSSESLSLIFVPDGGDAAALANKTTVRDSISAISINVWRHYAFTKNGTDIRLYVDGVRIAETITVSGSGDGTSVHDADADLRIGDLEWGSSVQQWAGQIDEVRIYDGALTSAQVSELYGGGVWRRFSRTLRRLLR